MRGSTHKSKAAIGPARLLPFAKERSGQSNLSMPDQRHASYALGLNCLGVAPTSLRIILLRAVASL